VINLVMWIRDTRCYSRVVQFDLLEFEVFADGVRGGELLRPFDEDLHVIELLVQTLYKVKNKVTISDGLTQGTKVVDHALHSTIVVADAEVALHEDAKPSVELQNAGLTVVEELSQRAVSVGSRMILGTSGERVLRIHVTTMLSNLS
jgi:hypothetical protein